MSPVHVLGIDPGLAATGYGLIGPEGQVLAGGTIRTAPGPIGARLELVAQGIEELLARHRVDEVSIEELFAGRNRSSVIGVAQSRGAVLLVLERAGKAVFEYKPAQIKAVLTGYGVADKSQMVRMLASQLQLPSGLDDHGVDALALALCHLRSRRLRRIVGI